MKKLMDAITRLAKKRGDISIELNELLDKFFKAKNRLSKVNRQKFYQQISSLPLKTHPKLTLIIAEFCKLKIINAASLAQIAVMENNLPLLQHLLINYPLNINNITNNKGMSLLAIAAKAGNSQAFKLLLKHTTLKEWQAKDKLGRNLLHHIASSGSVELLQILQSKAAAKNLLRLLVQQKNNNGRTPLHTAAKKGWGNLFDKLKAINKDSLTITDNAGLLPEAIGAYYGQPSIVPTINALGTATTINTEEAVLHSLGYAAYKLAYDPNLITGSYVKMQDNNGNELTFRNERIYAQDGIICNVLIPQTPPIQEIRIVFTGNKNLAQNIKDLDKVTGIKKALPIINERLNELLKPYAQVDVPPLLSWAGHGIGGIDAELSMLAFLRKHEDIRNPIRIATFNTPQFANTNLQEQAQKLIKRHNIQSYHYIHQGLKLPQTTNNGYLFPGNIVTVGSAKSSNPFTDFSALTISDKAIQGYTPKTMPKIFNLTELEDNPVDANIQLLVEQYNQEQANNEPYSIYAEGEYLYHGLAYEDLSQQKTVPALEPENGDYKVHTIHNKNGFVVYALVKDGTPCQVKLLFRGTHSIDSAIRDLEPGGAGTKYLKRHNGVILAELESILHNKKGTTIDLEIGGHSLGGASAQNFTSYLLNELTIRQKKAQRQSRVLTLDTVSNITVKTYNAAGISNLSNMQAEKSLAQISPYKGPNFLKIYHQRVANDLVGATGETHLLVNSDAEKAQVETLVINDKRYQQASISDAPSLLNKILIRILRFISSKLGFDPLGSVLAHTDFQFNGKFKHEDKKVLNNKNENNQQLLEQEFAQRIEPENLNIFKRFLYKKVEQMLGSDASWRPSGIRN